MALVQVINGPASTRRWATRPRRYGAIPALTLALGCSGSPAQPSPTSDVIAISGTWTLRTSEFTAGTVDGGLVITCNDSDRTMIVNQDGALFTGSISDGIQRCTVTYPSGESIASERPSATGEIVQGYISERFGGVRSTDLERYDVIFQFAPDAGSRAGQLSLSDSPEFYGDLGDIQTAPQWRANRMAGPVWMTYRLEPGVGEPGGVYRGPGDWVATRSAAQPSGPIQWRLEDGGNGHYYQLSLTLDNPGDHYLSWTQARALAETLSFVGVQGHLVTLTSAEENAWVVQHIAPASRNPAPLLGGFQPPGSSEPDGEWQWVTGEPFVYTNWAPLEPNEAVPGADYLVYTADPEPTVGTWNDVADLVSAYIVEFDTIPTTPIGAAPLARRVPTPGDTPR